MSYIERIEINGGYLDALKQGEKVRIKHTG